MKKVNEWFICVNCKNWIDQAEKTCRNHCPYCFISKHVDDDIPGDRNSTCKWTMFPKTYEILNWEVKILFECEKCWKQHKNKTSTDDEVGVLDKCLRKF